MSNLERHEGCPRCIREGRDNNRDNLGIFSDGHSWCFSCGLYIPASGVSVEELRKRVEEKSGRKSYPNLPNDLTHILSLPALVWLKKYGITKEEREKYRLAWSPSLSRLIIPIHNEHNSVIFWQGRYIGPPPVKGVKRAKYWTDGESASIDAYFGDQKSLCPSIVVVEDFVSAIKVGRTMPALCLWGSELSVERLRRLGNRHKSLIIWLDYDKCTYAAKCVFKAQAYFDHVAHICTTRDPKEHTDEEIVKCLMPGQ